MVRLQRTREVLGEAGTVMDSYIRALLTQGALGAWGRGRFWKSAHLRCSLSPVRFCFSLLPGSLLQSCSVRSSGQEAFNFDLPLCIYGSQRYGGSAVCLAPGNVQSSCLWERITQSRGTNWLPATSTSSTQ